MWRQDAVTIVLRTKAHLEQFGCFAMVQAAAAVAQLGAEVVPNTGRLGQLIVHEVPVGLSRVQPGWLGRQNLRQQGWASALVRPCLGARDIRVSVPGSASVRLSARLTCPESWYAGTGPDMSPAMRWRGRGYCRMLHLNCTEARGERIVSDHNRWKQHLGNVGTVKLHSSRCMLARSSGRKRALSIARAKRVPMPAAVPYTYAEEHIAWAVFAKAGNMTTTAANLCLGV